MAKVPGDSLGVFLRKLVQQRGAASPNPQAVAHHFAEACNFALQMLLQLLPTFEVISQMTLHRDINTHNVLVSTDNGTANPMFNIIDFGLAIDMKRWPHLMTQVSVVGDCRYWPPSAWYIFAAGGAKLAEKPHLRMEYMTQLDLHALGITALQVFVEMLMQPMGPAAIAAIPEEIWALKGAWDYYWKDARTYWEPLFRAFELKTDWNALRASYRQSQVHKIIDYHLGQLRQALSNVRNACARATHGSPFSNAQPLFASLLELISQGGKPLPEEAASCGGIKLTSWPDIRSILGMPVLTRSNSQFGLGAAVDLNQSLRSARDPPKQVGVVVPEPSRPHSARSSTPVPIPREIGMPMVMPSGYGRPRSSTPLSVRRQQSHCGNHVTAIAPVADPLTRIVSTPYLVFAPSFAIVA
jgi:hypothetical protein